ncbi:MAG: aminotransferase class V-fold PLP-dependent enzyme [Desulfurococcaceae archaeon]
MEGLNELLEELERMYERTPKHVDGSVLGSMTTWPHPVGVLAFLKFMHVNGGDPETFDVVSECERGLVEGVGKLYGASAGIHTSGGTESNILALFVARRTRKGGNNVVVAPSTVHVSIEKACELMGCRLVKVPADPLGPVDAGLLERYVREHSPFAVVITAGTTEAGAVDPVEEAAELAEKYGFHLHVDAAYGGLIIPFLRKHGLLDVDLRVGRGVASLSVDMHKLGGAPIPSGLLFFEDDELLEAACFRAAYMPSGRICGLLGTRPGGAVVASYFTWRAVGVSGYENNALRLMELAKALHDGLRTIEGIEAFPYTLPILVFRSKLMDPEELARELRNRGLHLYRAPSVGGLRVVLMPHHQRKHVDRLLKLLAEIHQRSPGNLGGSTPAL